MSYSVSRRRQEIGIRIALGAQTRDILRLVLGRGIKLVIIGVVLGGIGALVSTRLVASLLFAVSAFDPLAFSLASLLLAGVGISTSYFPARQATAVDPMTALRAP